ncbi:TetR family transcriptional regulator [Prauserella shujinwangii]|uniref:TetR family transcriptional regulator n=1 Tax=Prauserella shujinwangii TaxID=1453103 RepID=A0A2T0M0M9_9PSEU|nr:TetR/AcrR family transcriptional regulator [Prauserella shujinwangii]PRX50100.1 TetR family transcriptional regulator [Prauserella shujinwangii]
MARVFPGTPGAASGLARKRRKIDDGRREAIVVQLREIILSEGFARTTSDELSARLQCSKSTLYAIASSKHHLVATVLKHFFREAAENVEKEVAAIEDPAARISTYLAAVGTQMRRMSSTCYQDMLEDDATREIYVINSAAAARRVRELVHQGVDAGHFRPVHAEFVAEAVGLLIEGIQNGELLDRTGLSNGDAFMELSDLVVTALTNQPGQQAT